MTLRILSAIALSICCTCGTTFATPITLNWTTSVDLSAPPINGSSNTTVIIQYTFDDAQSPINTSSLGAGTSSYYGGINGTAYIGTDIVTFTNGRIYVYDNWPTVGDGYGLLLDAANGTNFVGSITDFGQVQQIAALEFTPLNVLSSSTALVTSLAVLNSFDFENFDLYSINGQSGIKHYGHDLGRMPTISAAETPLPAALPLFASGLGALGLLSWRRKKRTSLAA